MILYEELESALEGMHEMISYVPEYFVEKHELNSYIRRAELALKVCKDDDDG
jgi:hypothetical protein